MLNDKWVSVPTGSEDFSFKNMRKNQYEEALFRCEDERYEIDMVIDNNASAINCLDGINREMSLARLGGGVAWDFRIDPRSLSTIHVKAIARIYGEFGRQALELLHKNPVVGVPVILQVQWLTLVCSAVLRARASLVHGG